METIGILYIIPVSQCDLKLTTSRKGILGGAALFGIICSSHLWGFLADTKGRRRVIQPTLFAAAILSIICSFVQNIYIFIALRFLNGFWYGKYSFYIDHHYLHFFILIIIVFSMSCASGSIHAYLGEFHNNVQRSRAIMSKSCI